MFLCVLLQDSVNGDGKTENLPSGDRVSPKNTKVCSVLLVILSLYVVLQGGWKFFPQSDVEPGDGVSPRKAKVSEVLFCGDVFYMYYILGQ